ncbi:ras and EF-hand domain-containing protein-like [Engraulis encrasicolus]|uniref:ras and EF-hand domain-containing protein-like n=1 Tax=Engraulis encrasicolus TaxID=184585 RepID=UPI002FD26667
MTKTARTSEDEVACSLDIEREAEVVVTPTMDCYQLKDFEDSVVFDEDFSGRNKMRLETCLVRCKAKYEKELADSRAEVHNLRQENEQLRTGLLKAQAEVARMRSQLDQLRQEFTEMATSTPFDHSSSDCIFVDQPSTCGMPSSEMPGLLRPTQKRTLFFKSGFSDSESILDPLSIEERDDSDREGPQTASALSKPSSEIPGLLRPTQKRTLFFKSGLSDSESILDPLSIEERDDDDKEGPQTVAALSKVGLLCRAEKGAPTGMCRLVLAGDVGSGKSSFLLRLSHHTFREDMLSTVGVDCKVQHMVVEGKRMALQIWDTAGQERFQSISRSYFQKAHGILLLYDLSNKKSFINITKWLEQIEACTDTAVPMCLVGNKADLRETVPDEQCVSWASGMRLAKACGALFLETSAKDGSNVVEAVLHLAREVKKAGRAMTDSSLQLSSLGDKYAAESKCC